MARVDLEIAPGLVEDETSFAIGQGGFALVNNMRPWRGRMQTIGGFEFVNTQQLEGCARNIFTWLDRQGVLNIAFGTNSHLYVFRGGDLIDITPADFVEGNKDGSGGAGYGTGLYGEGNYSEPSSQDSFPLTWSFSNYGENLIANARGQSIWIWENDLNTAARPLSGAPAQVQFATVTPERQVVAYGCNIIADGVFDPRAIRWSDIENPEDWSITPQNNAGEHIINDGGNLISAINMEQGIFVWSSSGLHFQQFIGDPNQTFSFQRLGENCGAAGPNSAAVIGQVAYWLSSDLRFWFCALGGQPQRLVSPITRNFSDNLAPVQQEKVAAATITEFNEIWFHYPDQRDGIENSRYVAYNVVDGTWFAGRLSRTAFYEGGAAPFVIGVDPDGFFYWHERGTSANGGPLVSEVESGDIRLPAAGNVSQIRGYWPDFDDQSGPVNFTVFTRFYPQDPETEHGPFVCQPGENKIDFQASGQIVRLKWESAAADSFFRLGVPNFDLVQRGRQ